MPADHRGWISFILAIMSLNGFKMSEDTFWTSRWGEGVRLFPCSTSLNFACERNRRWDVLSWKTNYSKLNLYHNNKRFRLEPPPLPPLCRGCNQPALDEVDIKAWYQKFPKTNNLLLLICMHIFILELNGKHRKMAVLVQMSCHLFACLVFVGIS